MTLRDISEFHMACELLEDSFPFSFAFGDVKDRASCAKSSAEVFDRLGARLGRTHDMVNVEAICSLLSAKSNQRRHPKELSKLWQTDKSGNISQADFVKVSCLDFPERQKCCFVLTCLSSARVSTLSTEK